MTFNGCKGVGIGLRSPHIRDVIAHQPHVDWFEVHVCNYMGGGLNRALLEQIAERYPLSFHGVNLNLAGTDPFDAHYLKRLRHMVDELNPGLISEHACFTTHNGHYFHDLLPVPYTDQAVAHLADRVKEVQDALGRTILIENLSRYVRFEASAMSEAEFLTRVAEAADCGLLLDLNNAYVNQLNLGESLDEFVSHLPIERVGEVHLAGFAEQDGIMVDTHSRPVSDAVWTAYAALCAKAKDIPCLIEWDTDLPDFTHLLHERDKALAIRSQVDASAKSREQPYAAR